MIEAARQDNQILVQNALMKLAWCRGHPGAADFLAAALEDRRTGDFAALALAEHGDRRAVPRLLDVLAGDNLALRGRALVALASFHETTLGYDPEAGSAARAAALRRWRAWTRRTSGSR
jgi:HEAT repeat protein